MIRNPSSHQYIDRHSRQVITEKLIGDRSVRFLYSTVRENSPALFRALTSARMSSLLSFYHYDFLDRRKAHGTRLMAKLAIDWRECLQPIAYYDTPRKVFERQIRFWETRPMTADPGAVVSPADARVLIGSFAENSDLFIKEKFFGAEELLGTGSRWHSRIADGIYGVFRLTPDKYHYNHLPVSGRIADFYEVDGQYHSCNPSALVALASLHAKNRRVVTIIDTDVEGGSRVGLVAMIEIVALMIGDIVQAYSAERYDDPAPIKPGMFVNLGCPKSLYRPGSSTDVLLFERGRMAFSRDIVHNSHRKDVQSRFSTGLGRPLVETDIRVRSTIGHRLDRPTIEKEGRHG
jgi:phosphatidylserine decarboxylase